MSKIRIISLKILCIFSLFDLSAGTLESFLQKKDSHFSWNHQKSVMEKEYSVHILQMTSQSWRDENEVNRTLWNHWIKVIIPNKVTTAKALLFIKGGEVTDQTNTEVSESLVRTALATQSVVAEFYTVPNQPLKFAPNCDKQFPKKSQKEDELIAFTWKKFLTTQDDSWPLQLPMTKSVIKAMDCLEQFLVSLPKNPVKLEGFLLSGASKRGLTAYLAAAVDPRVQGIMPAACDLLNMKESFKYHFQSYGSFSPAINDYLKEGIDEKCLTSVSFDNLLKIVDPFAYKDKLTMPKYIVNSTGDAFSPPDSSRYYFSALPGKKYIRYVPNTNHSLEGSGYVDSVLAFYEAVVKNKPLPILKWVHQKDGTLLITTSMNPYEVTLWQTTNKASRDFRLDFTGKIWEATPLKKQTDGIFLTQVATPKQGWTAYFVELKYPNGKSAPYIFTTEVFITPDEHPFQLEVK